MLVLSRYRDSAIQIGADVRIIVLEVHKGRVKLGIHAPNEVSVRRGGLLLSGGVSHSDAAAAALPAVTTRPP